MPSPERAAVIATLQALYASLLIVIAQLRDEPTGVRSIESRLGQGQRWLKDCRADPLQIYNETRLRLPVFEALVNHI
ncbi:hypothetical protein GQ44DRAFT_703979 [Phaeosphaeriaceae sp. PMI808]|nr:hypothetical protein GQ44DRAFT_703979 [Phaeosphaeriaceae sp. PMI808]